MEIDGNKLLGLEFKLVIVDDEYGIIKTTVGWRNLYSDDYLIIGNLDECISWLKSYRREERFKKLLDK